MSSENSKEDLKLNEVLELRFFKQFWSEVRNLVNQKFHVRYLYLHFSYGFYFLYYSYFLDSMIQFAASILYKSFNLKSIFPIVVTSSFTWISLFFNFF